MWHKLAKILVRQDTGIKCGVKNAYLAIILYPIRVEGLIKIACCHLHHEIGSILVQDDNVAIDRRQEVIHGLLNSAFSDDLEFCSRSFTCCNLFKSNFACGCAAVDMISTEMVPLS